MSMIVIELVGFGSWDVLWVEFKMDEKMPLIIFEDEVTVGAV